MLKLLLVALPLLAAADEPNQDGLIVETTFMPEECEQKSKKGDNLGMHYTGTIAESSETGEKGKQFDSSVGRGPFDFVLGAGRVIKGWDQGLNDMCIGEKRSLTIPPELGYGDSGAGADIPGGATLHFDVELLTIGAAPAEPNIFTEIDADEDGKLTEEEIGAWFKAKMDREIPEGLMENEDKDKDGFVSWDEFSGPKGSENPADAGPSDGAEDAAEEAAEEAHDEL
jgi:FK506-binding protein 14